MKIVVTGIAGQVAKSLVTATVGRRDVEVVAIGRPELDLLDRSTIRPALERARPDLVVSAAAYTAVDQAEDEPYTAFAINAVGAGAVAAAAAALGVPVLHFSTDYIFDGLATTAYGEEAAPAPQSVYGHSKLAGEHAVAAANSRHLILRTAWVFSPYGKNFVKTILRLAETRDEIAVVSDQWGSPTCADDIADAVLHAAMAVLGKNFDAWGVFHLAGTGDTNWSGLARHVLEISRRHKGPFARVTDIATAEYPTRARRPANSRLSSHKFSTTFAWRAPHWQDSTAKVVVRLLDYPSSSEQSRITGDAV